MSPAPDLALDLERADAGATSRIERSTPEEFIK
jgi:hypothetical protein